MYSKELKEVIKILNKNPSVDPSVVDVVKGRERLETLSEMVQVPSDVTICPVDVDGIPGEIIDVPGTDEDRIILFLHGGAYLFGSIRSHREFASRISRACKMKVLLIDYRLAPENPFPAAVEDAKKAYKWLLKGYDPKKIVFAGDSAGGGLVLAAAVALRDNGEALPGAIICMSPWTNLAATQDEINKRSKNEIANKTVGLPKKAEIYLNGADPKNPYASPAYADFTGLPPILIQAAGNETLLLDATMVAERARKDGVDVKLEIWDNLFHVWQAFAVMLPEGQQAIDHIGEFVCMKIK